MVGEQAHQCEIFRVPCMTKTMPTQEGPPPCLKVFEPIATPFELKKMFQEIKQLYDDQGRTQNPGLPEYKGPTDNNASVLFDAKNQMTYAEQQQKS